MQIQLDDAFQFGLGAFETIGIRDGKPLLLPWHLERLNHSLEFLGIGQKITEEDTMEWLSQQDLTQIPQRHALKIMVSGENCLFLFRGNPYDETRLQQGFRLGYSEIRRNETSPLVYHKTMNYGDNIMEKRRTKERNLDEVLFLNSRGEICEGSTTNVFFVRNGQIFTPRQTCGLLPGIMRRFVIEQLGAQEKILHPRDTLKMEECFVTNSLMGVMPVTELDGRKLAVGSVTKTCMKYWENSLRE